LDNETAPVSSETLELETVRLILSKLAKLDHLEQTINRQIVTIVPEPETPAQIPETFVAFFLPSLHKRTRTVSPSFLSFISACS
jgi:hypothetical protein